jgi:hypothetical protein
MRISIHIRRVLLRLGASPYTHRPNANMLSLIVGVCRIASFGVAITAGYTGHPALSNFRDKRAKTLDKRAPGIRQWAVAGQDHPCRSVRRGDWQGHHFQGSPEEIADHHQPRHDRDEIGGVEHLADKTVRA